MLRAGLHVNGAPLFDRDLLTLDVERAPAFEDDVNLVPLMWLLPVGFRCHEHINPELDAGRRMDDFVASAAGREAIRDPLDVKRV
jgi:hypothetical protein